jgi:hypothetical protein
MNLKFSPRSINEIENEQKKPFQDVLAEFSLRTIVLFVKKGMGIGTDEDAAYAAITEYLSDKKNDTLSLYVLIMEGLQNDGFLPRSLKLESVKKDLREAMEKVADVQAPSV